VVVTVKTPAPGRIVNLGTHRLHVRCAGDGTPVVVCDAALGGSSLSWTLVEPAVSRVTRFCTYDRAGFGWSDAGPLPRTAGRIADELQKALELDSARGPFVLVGHSFGGLVMRLFAARQPQHVAALVLIEPAVPEDFVEPSPELRAHMARGVRLCGYGTAAARFGIARAVSVLASAGAIAAARSITRVVSRGALRREDEGILAPIWRLPPEVRRLLRQMWIQPKFFEALRSQIETVCESAAEVLREAPPDYGDLPVVVITGENADARRLRADQALARLSTRGRHVLAAGSGHWVPLDAPSVVSDAIIRVVTEVRSHHAR
jgi:pimeloyl-ACP methyl ester carboxylesterase